MNSVVRTQILTIGTSQELDELAHLFDSLSRISTVYSHKAMISC